MKKPNLFILGAPKCGTTAMANWLSAHPDIFVSETKEPHFFSDEHKLTKKIEDYEMNFDAATADISWVCEASVWYLFSKTAVLNILEYSKDPKFIVMLRNPVDMALSMHEQHKFNGNELISDFKGALDLNDDRENGRGHGVRKGYNPVQHLAYYKSCALGWQVEQLLSRVSKEKVHFVLFDDLSSDPSHEHRRVLEFLGVDSIPVNEYKKVNPAKKRKSFLLDHFVLRLASLKKRLGIKMRFNFLAWLRKWNVTFRDRESLDQASRAKIAKVFSSDTKLLSSLIDKDLRYWIGDDIG